MSTGDELAAAIVAWAESKVTHPTRWKVVADGVLVSYGREDNGCPFVDVRDSRGRRELNYRVRFTRNGPTLWEWDEPDYPWRLRRLDQ